MTLPDNPDTSPPPSPPQSLYSSSASPNPLAFHQGFIIGALCGPLPVAVVLYIAPPARSSRAAFTRGAGYGLALWLLGCVLILVLFHTWSDS